MPPLLIFRPMPLYEYECTSCQKIHEVIQKFSDAPLTECPECKGAISKLMSRSSFALKGSGWYTTDYKRGSSASSAPAKCETKSESKSADAAACGSGGCSA